MLSRKQPGILLVSRGSGPNIDPEALSESNGIAQIRAFNISAGRNSSPYEYTDGVVVGWGLRNSVGIAEHPQTGGIWSVENSADNLHRDGEDIHINNPGEELNFHGYLNGSEESQGGNYGYPLCFAVWSTDDFPNRGNLTTGDQFVADWDEGDTVLPTDAQCNSNYTSPALAFQAHMAPLDIKFNTNGTEAFISFHGSCQSSFLWN
jgi:glucose/arabinose dehydrogenase